MKGLLRRRRELIEGQLIYPPSPAEQPFHTQHSRSGYARKNLFEDAESTISTKSGNVELVDCQDANHSPTVICDRVAESCLGALKPAQIELG